MKKHIPFRLIASVLVSGSPPLAVKGVKFKNLKPVGDPVSQAKIHEAQDADEIFFYAIDHEAQRKLTSMVGAFASESSVPVSVGGGIDSVPRMKTLLAHGADRVVLPYRACLDTKLMSSLNRAYGAQALVCAITYISSATAIAQATLVQDRVGEIVLTAMDRDGSLLGLDTKTLRKLYRAAPKFGRQVVLSGGAGSAEHLAEAWRCGASGALLGSVLTSSDKSIPQIKARLEILGVPLRRI